MSRLEEVIKGNIEYLESQGHIVIREGNSLLSENLSRITFQQEGNDVFYAIGESKNLWTQWKDEVLHCPNGGDETNDCEGCIESGDYHFENGECVYRII